MKILKYNLATKVNSGTENEMVVLSRVEMPYSETNEEIAKREAYNGEYTIEDDGQPEPERVLSPEERIAELEAALALLLSEKEK